MARVCIGMETDGGDDRIGCCFSTVESGKPAALKCVGKKGDKQCVFCSRAKLQRVRYSHLLRLLGQLAEPYRAIALSRCSVEARQKYDNDGAEYCIGADHVRCCFTKRRPGDDITAHGRPVQLRGMTSRCVFCNIPTFREKCCDRRSRGELIKRLSRCHRSASELCILQRVPDTYRVEFATAVLYSQEKKTFDTGLDDVSVYQNVPLCVIIQWAYDKECDNIVFRSARYKWFCRSHFSRTKPVHTKKKIRRLYSSQVLPCSSVETQGATAMANIQLNCDKCNEPTINDEMREGAVEVSTPTAVRCFARSNIDNDTEIDVLKGALTCDVYGMNGTVNICNEMKKGYAHRGTTKQNTIDYVGKEGRLDMEKSMVDKNNQLIHQESLYIIAFLHAHGQCSTRQRHATTNGTREMSTSEQRWVLERRSKVRIERGNNIVTDVDYINWHTRGLSEPNGLKDGITPEAIKMLCSRYDEWTHANRANMEY